MLGRHYRHLHRHHRLCTKPKTVYKDYYFISIMNTPNHIRYSPSIARISTPVDPTKQAVGTGWIVDSPHKNYVTLVTNAHVVAPGKMHRIEMCWCHGKDMPAEVSAICYDRDLALLKVHKEVWDKMVDEYVTQPDENKYIKSAPPIRLGEAHMFSPMDTKVWCQGHPLGLPHQQTSWGNTRGIYEMPNQEIRYLIQAPINHGNSGGPVFVEYEGENYCVGISTMKLSGEQVEGEGGMITVMELKAVLPSMMATVNPPATLDAQAGSILAMLQKALGPNVQIQKVAGAGIVTEKQAKWLSENMSEFEAKWEEHAVGGRVAGAPRVFQSWLDRHVYNQAGGTYLLAMTLHMCQQGRYAELARYKSNVGGWREIRCDGEKHVMNLDLGALMKHASVPKLLHAPIFGWQNCQSVQNVAYREYYNIADNEKISGVIVNTVLPSSLYALGKGLEDDLIYAFEVTQGGKQVIPKTMLNNEGHFSEKGSALDFTHTLTSKLQHLEWQQEGKAPHVCKLYVIRGPALNNKRTEVVFNIASPTPEQQPKMRQVYQFNNESGNVNGVNMMGIKLIQCNLNVVKECQVLEYADPKAAYLFRVVCIEADGKKIMPGSTLTRFNGKDVTALKSWEEFAKMCQEFQAELESSDKPSYCCLEFERTGFKCKVINKV